LIANEFNIFNIKKKYCVDCPLGRRDFLLVGKIFNFSDEIRQNSVRFQLTRKLAEKLTGIMRFVSKISKKFFHSLKSRKKKI